MRLSWAWRLFLFFLAVLAAAPAVPAATVAPPRLDAASQPFHRGINVLGYDPYWNQGGKRRFEWRHFTVIHNAGFDFVRVNLQPFKHMDAPNRLEAQWL